MNNYFNSADTHASITAAYVQHQLNPETTLHIWDTAGQERFESMTPTYFRGADVIMLVFSLID